MPPCRFPAAAAAALLALASLPLLSPSAGAAGLTGDGMDALVPLNGTATGDVPDGGGRATVGLLLAKGIAKGNLQVKGTAGSTLVPSLRLVHPDGTVQDVDDLVALGAKVKAAKTTVTISNLPTIAQSGLYRVVVEGADDGEGIPTSGGFTLKLKGKPGKGFKTPVETLATQAEKDDFTLTTPEKGLLTLSLKPSKGVFFTPTLQILTGSGDAVPFDAFAKIGSDDSISIKNMPLPFFGDYTLRVGSSSGAGTYTLSVKVKASKTPPAPGAPTADAGDAVLVPPGGTATLDGSGSTAGATLQWARVSGPAAPLSSTSAAKPVVTGPAGRASVAFQLVARNGAFVSEPDLVLVEVDRLPVADAGPSVHLPVPAEVTLDGTGSFDLDAGDDLTYSWTQASGPAASLDDPSSPTPSFTPGGDGLYAFDLVVHDGTASSDPSRVLVGVGASSPVADAGRTITVRPQDTVFLSGLRSRSGAGGTPSSFSWSAAPGNPAVVGLAGAAGPVASFTAPKTAAELRFRLVVEGNALTQDEVLVIVSPSAPVNGSPVTAAGSPQSVATGAAIDLDGSGSTDDGGVEEISWMQLAGPDASLLDEGTAASATAPGTDATLVFLAIAYDGRKYGAPDTVAVSVGNRPLPAAHAGTNRSGDPLENLSLSSALSAPAAGQSISSRQWTQLSGKDWYDIDAQDAGFDPSSASPTVKVPDTVSSLTSTRQVLMGLVVTDGAGSSASDYVTLTFTNLPTNARPAVTAGVSAPVFRPGDAVSLTASGTDADGDPVTYSWSQVSGPTLAITGPTTGAASVTAPVATATLVFRVTVNDGTGEPNATATADVTFSVNQAPVIAISGTPASGPAGTLVTLSGVGTTDPEGETLSYAWTEIPPAVGSPVTLTGAGTITASFTMPAYSGSMTQRRRTFRLTVTDGMGASRTTSQTVQFTPNAPPTLNGITAAGDRLIFYSDSAATSDKRETLTAGPTTDADGDLLTFSWSIIDESGGVNSPLNQSSLLSATSGTSITFGAPKPTASVSNTGGTYVIQVVGSDGIELSAAKTIYVTVQASWSKDIYPMISGGCLGTGGCHGAGYQGNLFLGTGAQTALYGAAGSWSSPTAISLLSSRVAPNNYQNSSLYTRIQTGNMPKTGGAWSAYQYNMIRDWIQPEHNDPNGPSGITTGAEDN
ncbi:MAG: hypothetical protein L6R43_07250 [Planctomycetes bacterium]|nr:hypothetical protein [Planctomycetota bacterium]MCK6531058.1 hypothetical protein [Myxococcota bacterium]